MSIRDMCDCLGHSAGAGTAAAGVEKERLGDDARDVGQPYSTTRLLRSGCGLI